jgi:hypothetical protein
MKTIVETLAKKGILCRSFDRIEPRELGSRKRVELYRGVAPDDYYCLVIVVRKKSRILKKEAEELMELHRRMEEKGGAKIRRNYLLYAAPLCSKAADALKEKGWKLIPLAE